MYKILQSTDWSFLVGEEVIQIAIGFNDIQITLFKDASSASGKVRMWCEFQHSRGGQLLSDAKEAHVRATTLVSLLGKKVEAATAVGEEVLILRFADDETLRLIVDDAPYEQFAIGGPRGLLVV